MIKFLCKIIACTICCLLSSLANSSITAVIELSFERCRSIVQPERRLDCYDNLDISALNQQNLPSFEGKRTVKTDVFELVNPTILRYHSDGVIFVLSIHDETGTTLKNLHIGGGGEDTYLIEKPGKYYLSINGSDTWKIWLETP